MALLAALTGFVATWVVTLGLAAIIPHLSASTTVDEAILSAVAFSAWSIFLAPIASFVGWRSVREKNQSRYESASTIEERINNLQSASYFYPVRVRFALSDLQEVPYEDFSSLLDDVKSGQMSYRIFPDAELSKKIYDVFCHSSDKLLIIAVIALSICASAIGVGATALGLGLLWLALLLNLFLLPYLIKSIFSRALLRAVSVSEQAFCIAYCLHLVEITTPDGQVLIRGEVPRPPLWFLSSLFRKLRYGAAYSLLFFVLFIPPLVLGLWAGDLLGLEDETVNVIYVVLSFPWFLLVVTRMHWLERFVSRVAEGPPHIVSYNILKRGQRPSPVPDDPENKDDDSHSPIKAGKEVATTIKALEDLRPRYDSEGIFHSYAVDDVFKQAKKIIRADKKDVVEGIAKDGRDPAEIALTALWNVSNQVVSSGRYHVYRGILTDQGKGYLYAYKKTVDVLLDKGFIDKEEAKSNRKSIKENIKSAG